MRRTVFRVLALLTALGWVALGGACKRTKVLTYETKTAKTKGAAQALEDEEVMDPDCPNARVVKAPAEGSPEAVIRILYQAASDDDDDANFQTFYAQFSSKHEENWVREQYWVRLRKHVDKYVAGPDNPAYTICKEARKGDDEIKFFIRSKDKRKSNPPITLKRADGTWKVDFFSY